MARNVIDTGDPPLVTPQTSEPIISDGSPHVGVPDDLDEAPRCEACEKCAAEREHISGGRPSWENIPELRNEAELQGYPGLTRTQEQHIADTDGILAHYAFNSPVQCSLKGSHLHQRGVVVHTLCSLVLCMGKDCGKKSIVNFSELWRRRDERVEFHVHRSRILGWDTGFERRLDRLQKDVKRVLDWQQTIESQLPEVSSGMRARRKRGASGAEVHIPAPRRADQPEEFMHGKDLASQVRHIQGMDPFFRGAPKTLDLHSELRAYCEELALHPPVDGRSASELVKRLNGLEKRASAAEAWVGEARKFVSLENLQLVLLALNVTDPRVESVDGGSLRVSYFGRSALIQRCRATK